MFILTYINFPGEIIILGLPAFIKLPKGHHRTMFYKTRPVTKIHPNGDFQIKNGLLFKRT